MDTRVDRDRSPAKTEQSPPIKRIELCISVMGGERRYTADVKSEFLLDNYRSVRSWWNKPVDGRW